MSDEIESLRAEVAALRAEVEGRRADGGVTRRRLLTGLAGLGAAGAAGVVAAPSARAADGDFLILGENNEATKETFISVKTGDNPSEVILNAQQWGIHASGEDIGVLGVVSFGGVAGVLGFVDGPAGTGVIGEADDVGGIGVVGQSKAGPAIAGLSELDGVTLELTPAERTGPPTSMPADTQPPFTLPEYRIGALSVDDQGEVWLCTETGAPGTWTRLLREDTAPGRVIPITPFRALDTRATGGKPAGAPVVPGQKKGPINGGETITLDLAGVDPIPTTASGVVGNVTIVKPTYNGFLTAGPSGTSPQTSALNFARDDIVGNGFTSQLGPDGLSIKGSGGTSNSYQLVVDVTAYLT